MSDPADQIAAIDRAERALELARFTADDGWALGSRLREVAGERQAPVVIEIYRAGGLTVFATALEGATSDNASWAARKIATALHFERSSAAVALHLRARGLKLDDYGLSRDRYAAAAGAVPLRVAGAGCVGAVAVSGLSGMEDHELAIDAIGWLHRRQA
ncbi:MAG: hypothetical protein EOP66_00300 [Sphingomonas sp.]|nr:MAG: hypothetical protein EOP66_00300 [Sphingomonas sp.]